MHKQYSRLVQVKARKRLGSDQLESDNNHLLLPLGHISNSIVDSYGITLGFKGLDAQAVFPLSTSEG